VRLLSKPTLVQGGVKVWHGASRLEVGGALRLRLEAPAFAKATARQGGKRTDDRGQEELGTGHQSFTSYACGVIGSLRCAVISCKR